MAPGFVDQGGPALLEDFDRLQTLFPAEAHAEKDLALCFLCLRWTTGDEGCRRGDPCELEAAV